jgi:Ca2+-binding EF-hand superfamily protein
VDEWLGSTISEKEAKDLVALMDMDQDGSVSLDDFVSFCGEQGKDVVDRNDNAPANILGGRQGAAIVDIKVSCSKAEEASFEELGYKQLEEDVNEGVFGKPVHIWFRRHKHGGAGKRLKPLVDIVLDPKNINSALVVDGYQCIHKNLSAGNSLAKTGYLWVRRATSEEEEARDAIIDVAITSGKAKDRTDKIHNPPSRGYVQVPGNLNKGTTGKDIYLWYRPAKMRQTLAPSGGVSSFHVSSTLTDEKRRSEMGKSIRRQIRQYIAPSQIKSDATGSPDYTSIFNKHDKSRKGRLTKSQIQKLLREIGLNVESKDVASLMGRIDTHGAHYITREEFLKFVMLTEDELDEVCETLRRKYGAGAAGRGAGSQRKDLIRSLRRKFEKLDVDGDGVLSLQDFSRMLEQAGIYLAVEEVESIRSSHFDLDCDGRVDLLNFLNFFLTRNNKEKRSAARVFGALEVLRSHVRSIQDPKKKGQNTDKVDSNSAWLELKKRHLKSRKTFPGFFVAEDVAMALQKLNTRLSDREVHQVVQRIAPLGGGRISEEDFHRFVCFVPRSTGQLLKVVERDALPELVEAYRQIRHTQIRRSYHERAGSSGLISTGGFHSFEIRRSPTTEMTGSFWETDRGTGDDHDHHLKDRYNRLLNDAAAAACPDDEGLTTVESLKEGLSAHARYEKELILDVEWAQLSQYVGADEPEHFLLDPSRLLEGICMAVMREDGIFASVTLEDVATTDEEALNLVCEDLVKMIQDEAKLPDGSFDYSKPFKLFDENEDGIIPIDEFRRMLYRLNVDSLLREQQIVALMNRFDTDRTGGITIKEFIAFAERDSWSDYAPNLGGTTTMFGDTNRDSIGVYAPPTDLARSGGGASAKSRFRGLLVTGDRSADSLVTAVARKLEFSHSSSSDVEADLMACFHTVDASRSGNISPSMTLTALRRVHLAPDLPDHKANQALVFFSRSSKGMGSNGVNYRMLVEYIKRAWRVLMLTREGKKSFTGSLRLDKKLVKLQSELRLLSTSSHVDPDTNETVHVHRMDKLFSRLDENGDGLVSPEEFCRVLRKLNVGDYMSESEMRRFFNAYDKNADGAIQYSELCDFLLHGKFLVQNIPCKESPCGSQSSDCESEDIFQEWEAGKMEDSHFWEKIRQAMHAFAPTSERQSRVKSYLRGKAKSASSGVGQISEGRFRGFLERACGPGSSFGCPELTHSEIARVIELLDPRCRGSISCEVFLDRAFRSEKLGSKSSGSSLLSEALDSLQEAVLHSAARGKPYHNLFYLSDENRSGLVSLDAFRVTLHMLGYHPTSEQERALVAMLTSRKDGMVDYEELHRVLMQHPPPRHLVRSAHLTSYTGGGALSWPPPTSLNFGGASPGWKSFASDPVMEDVAARVRQRVLEKLQQWGAKFSLSRQFEFHDPRSRGFVTGDDFSSVLEQLGVWLSGAEMQHMHTLFDRYGDGAMDYQDFCSRVLFDCREAEIVAHKLSSRCQDLRQRGVDVRSAFEMFDLGKTGFVSRGDFREAMRKLQMPITEHQLQFLNTKFGKLSDPDRISYEDLLSFVHTSSPRHPECRARHFSKSAQCAQNCSAGDGLLRGLSTGDNGGFYSPVQRKGSEMALIQEGLRTFREQQESSHRGAFRLESHRAPDALSPETTSARSRNHHAPLRDGGNLKLAQRMSSPHAWMCPVCFYCENQQAEKACEICNAPNPQGKLSEIKQDCLNCTYGNLELAVECAVCGEPLPYGRARRKQTAGKRVRQRRWSDSESDT